MTQYVLLQGQIYSIPLLFEPGHILTEDEAKLVGELLADAIAARMEAWLDAQTQPPRPDEIQPVANAFAQTIFTDTTAFIRESDPVYAEALELAREMILTKLTTQGLPAPRSLDAHAEALLTGNDELLERAKLRVEARIEIGRKALAQVEAKAGVAP